MKKIILAFIVFLFLGTNNTVLAENDPPIFLTGSPRDGGVLLQWVGSLDTVDHLVEYKQSSENDWIIFEHDTSTTKGIYVDDLENDTSYDFKVSSVYTGNVTSIPSNIISVTPSSNSNFSSNNQIISTGQSLANGFNSFGALTTTQPFSNKMLDYTGSSFAPLVETVTGGTFGTETMSSALANTVTTLSAGILNYSSIVTVRSQNGASYAEIKKGTDTYNQALTDIASAKFLSLLYNNKTLIVPAVTVIHGETDEIYNATPEQYEQYLVEWQQDYENDIQALTGQYESVPLFTDQMNSWTRFNFATPRVAIGQYNAAKNNPDKIILVGPKYMLDYFDGYHLRNYSSRRLGEYYGKVYKKVIIDGEEWKPLMPEEITLYGNEIHARFHVPVPPLAFDTTAVLAATNYGFEYADDTNSANITSVEIISADTVVITLDTIPTGPNPRLRYAYTGFPTSMSGSQWPGAPRGNLRDSDMTPAIYQDNNVPTYMGNYLHNWALTFDEPVTTSSPLPDAPTEIFAVAGQTNGSAVISFTAPTNTGSGAITGYTVTSTPGNIVATGTASPINISGLSNNTTYTFTVTATNQYGQSISSTPSNPINIFWSNLTLKPIKPAKNPPGVKPIRDLINIVKLTDFKNNTSVKLEASVIKTEEKITETDSQSIENVTEEVETKI